MFYFECRLGNSFAGLFDSMCEASYAALKRLKRNRWRWLQGNGTALATRERHSAAGSSRKALYDYVA
eukprot:3328051-Amphidinium_carterae.1